MALFCVDIGNTNILMGLYQGSELVTHWRIATDHQKMADEYAMLILNLFERSDQAPESVEGVIIASVVPPLTGIFEKLSRRYFRRTAFVVGDSIDAGVPVRYDNPAEVGADRVVNAVAACHHYGSPACVVDFGTATTFDALSVDGEYVGGAIAPGIGIAAEALFRRTSKLPRIDLALPPGVIGKNTVHSMQSGIVFGYVGLVDGLVRRLASEMEDEVSVIATGGLARLIEPESETIEEVDDFLTLEGLRLIYLRNV